LQCSQGEFERCLADAVNSDIHAPVDLLIRTGGERRLSDFLLWECAYAELVFVDEYWPDFDEAAFDSAPREVANRDRRFRGPPPPPAAPAAPRGPRARPESPNPPDGSTRADAAIAARAPSFTHSSKDLRSRRRRVSRRASLGFTWGGRATVCDGRETQKLARS